jgi:hypothetical protein
MDPDAVAPRLSPAGGAASAFRHGAKYKGRSPRVRVENALHLFSQIERDYMLTGAKVYFLQDQ